MPILFQVTCSKCSRRYEPALSEVNRIAKEHHQIGDSVSLFAPSLFVCPQCREDEEERDIYCPCCNLLLPPWRKKQSLNIPDFTPVPTNGRIPHRLFESNKQVVIAIGRLWFPVEPHYDQDGKPAWYSDVGIYAPERIKWWAIMPEVPQDEE